MSRETAAYLRKQIKILKYKICQIESAQSADGLSLSSLQEDVLENSTDIEDLDFQFNSLQAIQSIDSFNLVGTDLELLYTDINQAQGSVTVSLFNLQEAEIKANVQNYNELLTVPSPDLYQFAYVRESQGSQWQSAIGIGKYYGSGLYMWNGTEWIEDDTDVFNQLEQLINNINLEIQERINADTLLQSQINEIKISTGWWDISDTTYTSSNPQTILSGVRTKLQINLDSAIESFSPDSLPASSIWDDTNNKITPLQLGDSYTFRLSLTANPVLNNRNLTVDLDIGGSLGVIFERSTRLARGANVDTKISMTNSIYSLGTFISNGGDIFITCDGDVDVFDISLFIQRITKND